MRTVQCAKVFKSRPGNLHFMTFSIILLHYYGYYFITNLEIFRKPQSFSFLNKNMTFSMEYYIDIPLYKNKI